MAKNTLRARLEVLGGKEIVGTFHEIERGAKSAFDTIEREAKEATRDVKDLERELAKLEAESKAIQASVKKASKGGSLTSEQKQALAFAKQLDNQAEGVRTKIRAANDSMKVGGGNALRTLAASADKDLLGVAKSTSEIQDAVESIRKGSGLGGLISQEQLDRLSSISDSMNREGTRWGENLQGRVESADTADLEKTRRRTESETKDQERFAKRQTAFSEARARERELDDAREAERDRARATRQAKYLDDLDAREKVRQKARADQQTAYLQKLDDRQTAHRVANEAHLQKIREENYRRQRVSAQRDLDRRQAQSRLGIARQIAQEQSAARASRSVGIELPEDLQIRRAARLRIEAGRREAEVKRVMGILSPSIDGGGKSGSRVASGIRGWLNDAKRLEEVSKGFKVAGGVITGTASDIGKGLSSTVGDIGKFVSAIDDLGKAVGTAGLRTGIVGLLGALGIGLAALGGAATLAGIAAISALAGMDATKIANAAAAIGEGPENYSRGGYAATRAGVSREDYDKEMQELHKAMVESMTPGEDKKGNVIPATGMIMDNRYGQISAINDKGELRDTLDVLKDIARAFKALPEGKNGDTLRAAILNNIFGGKTGENKGGSLLPLLNKGPEGISAGARESDRIGVTITPQLKKDMDEVNAQATLFLNIWRGIGYAIAKDTLPVIAPVMEQIDNYLVENREEISGGVVTAWNYLIQTIKDFWALWNQGDNANVVNKWTKTFYDGMMKAKDAAVFLWDQIEKGWGIVKGPLDSIGKAIGLGEDSGLSLALIGVTAYALGFFDVFKAGGKVVKAGVGVSLDALGLLLSPLENIGLAVLGFVNWPFALGAGLLAVYAYWDDITAAFSKAWDVFKEKFPQTASVLEKAFGPALKVVKDFWSDFNGEFSANYPLLKSNLDDLSDQLSKVVDGLSRIDWGMVLHGLGAGVLAELNGLSVMLRGLLGTLNGVEATVAWFASQTGLIDLPDENGNNLAQEKRMYKEAPDQWVDFNRMRHGDTALNRMSLDMDIPVAALVYGLDADGIPANMKPEPDRSGKDDPRGLNLPMVPIPVSSVSSPVSAATGASTTPVNGAAPTAPPAAQSDGYQAIQGTPFLLQINEGPQITAIATTPDLDSIIDASLSDSARARIVKRF